MVELAKDDFRPTTNPPTVTDADKLDFIGKDAEGNPCTPEGILK